MADQTVSGVLSSATWSIASLMRRHPLVSYFFIAYAGSWVLAFPLAFSQRGLGWITLPDPLLFVMFLLSTYTGPLTSALVVTRVVDGGPGVRRLFRRIAQWGVGALWYALVAVGYPLLFLLQESVALSAAPLVNFVENWPLLLTAYLPAIAVGMIAPGIGEEPGWRGFALPRLQGLYGPVVGSLILGVLHALWHTPAYFVRGAISEAGFDPVVFVSNTVTIVAFTFVWTWLFNNANGSVFFAMFVHATSNAASQLFTLLPSVDTGVVGELVPIVLALAVVIATGGRLAYRAET